MQTDRNKDLHLLRGLLCKASALRRIWGRKILLPFLDLLQHFPMVGAKERRESQYLEFQLWMFGHNFWAQWPCQKISGNVNFG